MKNQEAILNMNDYFTFLKQNRIKAISGGSGCDYGVSHPIYNSGRTSISSYVKKIKGDVIRFEFIKNEYWNCNDSSIEWNKKYEMITYLNGLEVDRDVMSKQTFQEKAATMICFINHIYPYLKKCS